MSEPVQKPHRMTVEEFLNWVERQPIPYELIRGTPRRKQSAEEMMAGTSSNHSIVAGNVFFILKSKLRGKPCLPHGSDHAVEAPEETTLYPDVSVDCGFKERAADSRKAVRPVLIVEVLSPSTRGYDQGEKFDLYDSILSVQYVLYIEQDKLLAKLLSRQSETAWLTKIHRSMEDMIEISDLELSMSMSEIYENIIFPEN